MVAHRDIESHRPFCLLGGALNIARVPSRLTGAIKFST